MHLEGSAPASGASRALWSRPVWSVAVGSLRPLPSVLARSSALPRCPLSTITPIGPLLLSLGPHTLDFLCVRNPSRGHCRCTSNSHALKNCPPAVRVSPLGLPPHLGGGVGGIPRQNAVGGGMVWRRVFVGRVRPGGKKKGRGTLGLLLAGGQKWWSRLVWVVGPRDPSTRLVEGCFWQKPVIVSWASAGPSLGLEGLWRCDPAVPMPQTDSLPRPRTFLLPFFLIQRNVLNPLQG